MQLPSIEHMSATYVEMMWNMIDEIDWTDPGVQTDFGCAKKRMIEKYDRNAIQLRQFVGYVKSDLYKIINDYEQRTHRLEHIGGDDSFDDLVSHIVGSGKGMVDKVVNDPSVVRGIDPVESFMYILPTEDDLELMDPEVHSDRAAEAIGHLIMILRDNQNLPETSMVVIEHMIDRFDHMYHHRFEQACGDLNVKMYRQFYEWSGNTQYATFANFLGDCAEWMLEHQWRDS